MYISQMSLVMFKSIQKLINTLATKVIVITLKEKTTHMLPEFLSTDILSLVPGKKDWP